MKLHRQRIMAECTKIRPFYGMDTNEKTKKQPSWKVCFFVWMEMDFNIFKMEVKALFIDCTIVKSNGTG